MSLLTLPNMPTGAVGDRHSRPAVWPQLLAAAAQWRQRQRTRQQLRGLDDRLLADVGLTREQRRIECAKAPWQP
ncbi:MAG: DUF1127 domain-containing protein [Enhydrobacter sp.]|nr:MAG: DUF1127 domain-containing protein [Enhydrobacter sp.]